MIQRAMASLWHWMQREDCTPQNLSIGFWQAARVYTLASEVDNARKYVQLCLDITPEEDPFYLGYAHEAIARAEGLAGDADAAGKHLETATQLAATIPDPEHRKMLEADLKSLA